MSYLTRATELVGRPVVTLDRAEDVAEVKDVVFDSARSELVGFTLRGRGLLGSSNRGHLRANVLVSIGRDAVMIEREADIVDTDADLGRAARDDRDVIGDEVLTDAGQQIGAVRDLVLEVERGRADVVGYEVETEAGARALVPLPETFAVSAETLVVPAVVERFITHDLTGFGGSVERFRDHLRTRPDDRPPDSQPDDRTVRPAPSPPAALPPEPGSPDAVDAPREQDGGR